MMRSTAGIAGLLLCLAFLLLPSDARALEVFACEPEWGALAKELGGDRADVFVATTARQDPHQIQARPSLIARLRTADLVVCTGAELEIGWLPMLLRQGANARVQPGSPGYFEAAQYVRLLEVPTRLDRAEGDIHAAGNPHIHTDPRNIAAVAQALAGRMQQLDPADAAAIAGRAQNFQARWAAAVQRWSQQAAPLRGVTIGAYHKSWVYLEAWLGLRGAGAIQPKPGVPPGSQYLAQLVGEWPARGVRGIIYSAYEDPRASEFVAQQIGVPAIMLPYTVGGTDRARDLFGLFDDTVERLMHGLLGGASARR
jgi:zinc/manganese transport system substrate-binding protein